MDGGGEKEEYKDEEIGGEEDETEDVDIVQMLLDGPSLCPVIELLVAGVKAISKRGDERREREKGNEP